MASPQLKNGHLKIANEIWEKLMSAGLEGSEYQLVMAVIRKTWGWNKKWAGIGLDEFAGLTGLSRRRVARSLHSLRGRNILSRESGGGRGRFSTWSLIKDWELWKTVSPMPQKKQCHRQHCLQNSVTDGIKRVSQTTLFSTTGDTVSPRKLKKLKRYEPPKDNIKDNKTNNHRSSSIRDQAHDIFAEIYLRILGVVYMPTKADWVQLARLRKSQKLGIKEAPADWPEACKNYCNSPMKAYTIAELVKLYPVCRKTELNQYGKPKPVTERIQYDMEQGRQEYANVKS